MESKKRGVSWLGNWYTLEPDYMERIRYGSEDSDVPSDFGDFYEMVKEETRGVEGVRAEVRFLSYPPMNSIGGIFPRKVDAKTSGHGEEVMEEVENHLRKAGLANNTDLDLSELSEEDIRTDDEFLNYSKRSKSSGMTVLIDGALEDEPGGFLSEFNVRIGWP